MMMCGVLATHDFRCRGAEISLKKPARPPTQQMACAASLARRQLSSLLVSSRPHCWSVGSIGSRRNIPRVVLERDSGGTFSSSFSSSKWVSTSSASSSHARPKDPPLDPKRRSTLLRNFLKSALYDSSDGYFSQQDLPVGSITGQIPFRSLLGVDEYNRLLAKKYNQLTKQWLTPVEIFKPHYSEAVAKYVLHRYMTEDYGKGYPLKVYELGGGSGTHAAGFLSYIKKNAPEVFANMVYGSVEISSALAAAQRKCVTTAMQTVGEEHASDKGKKCIKKSNPVTKIPYERVPYKVMVRDAIDRHGWGDTNPDPCFVVALEVLDNLPHDKVVFLKDEWMETRVFDTGNEGNDHYQELLDPVSDPLISRAMNAVGVGDSMDNSSFSHHFSAKTVLDYLASVINAVTGTPNTIYLPTGCLELLETLHKCRPNHRLIAADFDSLPGVQMPGTNAPLVATQSTGGKTKDLDSYLKQPGSADVFFPTDFEHLRILDLCARREGVVIENEDLLMDFRAPSHVVTTKAFMEKWADLDSTKTRSGYNPLAQDFANTKFFLSG